MIPINIKKDHLFKRFFHNDVFFKYFVDALFEYLGMSERFQYKVIMSQVLMSGKNLSEKDYYGDIIGLSETQEIISLEMYNSKFGSREYNKSYSYACRLYNGQLEIIGETKRKSYGEYKTVYSINFMNGNYLRNSEELINVYTMKNLKTNKIGKENIKVILIRLDKLKSIEYNKDESLVISIIRLINSENEKEMRKYIRKGERVMEDMYKYVKDLNKELQNNSFEQYIADINREGREIGQKRGLKQGQNIALKRTAKNLLQQNVSIEIIEKATCLSKKTILSLT